jgi:hypothetical protein
MKKVIKLTESELTTLVKRVIKEVAEEPIMDHTEQIAAAMFFDEGKTIPSYGEAGQKFSNQLYAAYVDTLAQFLSRDSETIKTIEKFYDNPTMKLPKFISVNVGTSHSGTGEKNAAVAQGRLDFLMGIVMKALDKLGLDSSVAKSLVVTNSNAQYKPKKLNAIYDPKKVQVNKFDRFGFIAVTPLKTKGLNTSGIQGVQKGLNFASSDINNIFVDGVNEVAVLQFIKRLETFSDIQDLSKSIDAGGKWNSLEEFLNDQLFDDPEEMRKIANHLKKLALDSQKQYDTVRLFSSPNGYKISIGLGM